ncbi:PREDICTED: unconventional myosin-Ib-like, partial [Priapulus caudatus]|uniref:Unconventional myosin-Ib-like n=1 Tax=Priapulus caudatus TaxID=37621 RepID=A0ABM1EFE5_PRICU
SHGGLFSLLDDECLRPGDASDDTFLDTIAATFGGHPNVDTRRATRCLNDKSLPRDCFRIRHYAGPVTYNVTGFLDRNNDLLYRDLSQAMYSCGLSLLKLLFPEGNPSRACLKRPSTAGFQLKRSLLFFAEFHERSDCGTCSRKNPNYIRCIKPNNGKNAKMFDDDLVRHQVRYSRVSHQGQQGHRLYGHGRPLQGHLSSSKFTLMENLKVRRAGFAFRQTHAQFLQRYKIKRSQRGRYGEVRPAKGIRLLLKELRLEVAEWALDVEGAPAKGIRLLLKELRLEVAEWALDLFELEDQRRQRLGQLATLLQAVYRGWALRHAYQQLRNSQIVIAKHWRRHKCYKYRLKFDQAARSRMREKVAASNIFKNRKDGYLKSVGHPFRGDYVRLRSNYKWKKAFEDSPDNYVVFADMVLKIKQVDGKEKQKVDMYRNVPHKDVMAGKTWNGLLPTSGTSEATKKKGDFILESNHVIEMVAKMFLLIINANGKPPEMVVASEFQANFNGTMVNMIFKLEDNFPDIPPGYVRINRKGNRMEILI